MTSTRYRVLEALAATTSADAQRTVPVARLAARLEIDEVEVLRHLRTLTRCDLAVEGVDDRYRISLTGKQLLALDVGDDVIVAPQSSSDA